jgi:sarcosine oxidase subunit alpha
MLFSAGFYYKTFMWPKSFWNKVYEPFIRGAAGLGKSPTDAALAAMKNVTLLTRTTAIGYYHQNFVGLCQRLTDHLSELPDGAPRERLWKVRAKQVVLAQGSIEKPLVFDGNDRPGVMLAGSARTYLNRYGVKVGNRPVVVTSHDSAWLAAFDLSGAGVKVAAIIDIRAQVPDHLVDRAKALDIETLCGWTVSGTKGRHRVSSVRVNPVASGGRVGPARTIACDVLLMSGGWTPSVHLFSHTKGKLDWNDERQMFLPGERTEDSRCAGAGNGKFGLEESLLEGASAGAGAATDAGFTAGASAYTVDGEVLCTGVSNRELPSDRNASWAKAFVDFQNDVTAKDIALRCARASLDRARQALHHDGMATDQGKTSNINGLAIAPMRSAKRPAPEVGLTTFRPPYTPTTFGAFAGAIAAICSIP